ncbi:MAG: ribose 5-phosphate isomerase B [Anaerolineae bacterium]|nr:ribose 5-phosphate isomerase B [Thermoflexales bacterium]MDW8292421.1 ribose 5-phosphate isomerase B [Anaerolineae bacterium]
MTEQNTKTVLLGCDEAAFHLKETIKAHLLSKGVNVVDYGVYSTDPVDYPDIALRVALDVAAGKSDRAILICGTGIGMAITANKVPGVYAALAHDTYSAERARKSNNAQVLTMGARVIGPELAKQIVDAWMASEFQGGNSARKVAKIAAIEKSLLEQKPAQPREQGVCE